MISPYLRPSQGTSELRKPGPIHPPKRIRAVLEIIAPQVHGGDHETTAEILHTGSQDSVAMERGRLLIYLVTNNMLHRFKNVTGSDVDLYEPSNMMGLLRSIGFLTKANIDRLGRSSNTTSQVFLELLLTHSILDQKSFDILGWLVPSHFDVKHSVQGPHWSSDEPRLPSLLQAASIEGNIDAVRLLLDLGADPYDNGGQRTCSAVSPLEWAAMSVRHDRATAIADLLLSKPTRSSSELKKRSMEQALHTAIVKSNTELIIMLLSESQYFGHDTVCSECLHRAASYADSATIRLLVEHFSRGGNRSIMLPEDILFSVIYGGRYCDDADLVLDKFNYLLDLGSKTAVSGCCDVCGQAFVLENVVGISFGTYVEITPRTYRHDRHDSQLEEDYVLKLVKSLREHGCPPERPKATLGGDRNPSALQIAISRRYYRVVEYLLEWGAEIDYHYQGNRHRSLCRCKHSVRGTEAASSRSPLFTALETQQAEIAKLLLTRKPALTLHGGERILAVRIEDPELITMLFEVESSDMDGWEHVLEEAVLQRSPELIKLLMSMDARGHATMDNVTALRAALITGDHDKAYQKLALCDYDSRALFDAVLESHRSEDYRQIVEHLLETRPKTPNDGFEVRAVASAAAHQDLYLMNVLMKSFGQGPWAARFPFVSKKSPNDMLLCYWALEEDTLTPSKHILNYAAELHRCQNDSKVIKTLLEFNVPAKGMQLDIEDELTAETWKQLIAAGANPHAEGVICQAVEMDMLAHVEVLCKAKVFLNTMHRYEFAGVWRSSRAVVLFSNTMHRYKGAGLWRSRTAVQAALESGSPEMLQMLLQYGGDVKQPAGSFRGATCLQIAAGTGDIGLVRLLLDKGAEVNAKRSLFGGRTAIEMASHSGTLDVLKLLLLQKEHLFQTAAARYQFIRAVEFAEAEGRECLITMLEQHINWDSNDQQLLDDRWLNSGHFNNICLDEMTQEPLDEEKQNPNFWEAVCQASRAAGFEDVYDIVGIEQWASKRSEEDSHDWITSGTDCHPEEDDLPLDNTFSTDRGHKATFEVTLAADKPTSQAGLQTDLGRPGELISSFKSHDTFIDQVDLPSGLMCEQPVLEWPAWRLNSETGESTQTSAPRALRYQDENPMWLDMEDNEIDNMMQDLSGGTCTQSRMVETLAHRPATQNVDREPGMVLGEVLDDAPHINDMGDDAVVHNGVGDIGEAEHWHMSQFNWGLWDDESFEFHSAAWENWNIGSGTAS